MVFLDGCDMRDVIVIRLIGGGCGLECRLLLFKGRGGGRMDDGEGRLGLNGWAWIFVGPL